MSYTTDGAVPSLVTGIKRRGAIPSAQATFQTADFLAMADSEIQTNLLPMILRARESYYSWDYTQAITPTNGVYAIPTRAVGAKLQNVFITDANNARYQLNVVDEAEIINGNVPISGNPSFYFKANNIVLVPPNPSNFINLTMTIFIRPSQNVSTSACGQITAINTGTNTVTVNALPSTFSTSTPLDFLNGKPHYDFRAIDQTPTNVNTGASTITFSSLPSNLAIGDWIALSQQTPVVQIPTEFQGILEQRVANSYLQSQGFLQALAAGRQALQEMEETFLLINPRSERTPKKIVNRSGICRRNAWWL